MHWHFNVYILPSLPGLQLTNAMVDPLLDGPQFVTSRFKEELFQLSVSLRFLPCLLQGLSKSFIHNPITKCRYRNPYSNRSWLYCGHQYCLVLNNWGFKRVDGVSDRLRRYFWDLLPYLSYNRLLLLYGNLLKCVYDVFTCAKCDCVGTGEMEVDLHGGP